MSFEVPAVREAGEADAAHLADVLCRAFLDDPVFVWGYREGRRERMTHRFFARRLRTLLPLGDSYTTGDLAGAALWAGPGDSRWPLAEQARLTLDLLGEGRRVPRIVRGFEMVDRKHPKEPHWYLAVLGTDPPRQGQGVGSALLAPILERIDADGMPAYLETAKERNVHFYTRHGFRVTEELHMPKGPPVWLMWRDPR